MEVVELAMGFEEAFDLEISDEDADMAPLTSMIPPEVLINGAGNTILYEQLR